MEGREHNLQEAKQEQRDTDAKDRQQRAKRLAQEVEQQKTHGFGIPIREW